MFVFAVALVVSRPALAQNPFLIDGIPPANGGVQLPPEGPDPFGGVQELGAMNASSTKVGVIHSDGVPTLDFTNPNAQVDLRRIWIETRKAANGHLWLYFAWERDSSNGSGFISIEFQQAALSAACNYALTGIDLVKPQSAQETAFINSCNPWSGRRGGDFLLLWDQSGNSTAILKRTFLGTAPNLALSGSVSLGSAVAVFGPDGSTGEAAINLTQDVFGSTQCVNFANVIPGTVTGNSDSADYKDTVLAKFDPISNCGTLKVKKITNPAGGSGTFPFTVGRTAGQIKFDGTTQLTGTLSKDGEVVTYQDVIEGTNYTLQEGTVPSPWVFDKIECFFVTTSGETSAGNGTAFTVEQGKTTECRITNTRQQGTLTVKKVVVNDNGGTASPADFQISLGDGVTATFAGSSGGTMFTFDVGHTFTVGETGPSGYAPSTTGTCSGTIAAGDNLTCEITNNDIPPSLTLVKVVTNDNGGTATPASFTLTASGPTPLTGSGPSVSSGATFSAGTYTLGESGPSDYTNEGWVCTGDGAQDGSSITLALAQSASCTITNDDALGKPSGSTLQRAVLHDSIEITGIRRGDGETLPLTATFRLYSNSGCTAQVGSDIQVNVSLDNGADTTGAATTVGTNGITVATDGGPYHWRVQFSGNNFNESFTTACGSEISTVTFYPTQPAQP